MHHQRRVIQTSSGFIKHSNNNCILNNNLNSNYINYHNTCLNQNNIKKSRNSRNTLISNNHTAGLNHPSNSYNNNNNYYYQTYNNKLNYPHNNSSNSLSEVNNDIKSNYSGHSNSSSNTIKSMLNTINKNMKSTDDISFVEIKCRKYPLESSNISSNESKYMSTNYYSINNNANKKFSNVPNSKNQMINYKEMNISFKQKIENAEFKEEILLPPYELNFNSLNITKPIRIKGQQNSCISINEGPILIDLEAFNNNMGKRINNTNSEIVKFSQLKIIYNDNQINREKKITTLFKLHPSSYLELEDCDLVFPPHQGNVTEKKSVAFVLSSNKKAGNPNSLYKPTILTLTNTRIYNFYQSIRTGQNCIVDINKSAFIKNYGKAIVMLNPISLKVNEAFFQYNEDNTIHVKYIDDYLYKEKRKILIQKNDFDTTNGNDICIEGLKNKDLDLSITINKNNFHNNTTDGVLIYNLMYNHFELSENIFKKNKGNGLNIQKSFFYGIASNNKNCSLYQPIKIKDNQFIENRGFGLFVNDCIIEATSNKFTLNKQSGMSLCNIMIDDPQKGYGGINLRANSNEDEYSLIAKSTRKCSNLLKNNFYENGESGLFIHGYPYHVNIFESVFKNNCGYGISMDLDSLYNNNYKHFFSILNEFKSITSKKSNDIANITLSKCVIERNMKAGILINCCLIYCEETFILNNAEYAISIKKKEYKNCFKDGKNNVVHGSFGGDWGKVDMYEQASCFSCMPIQNFDSKKKEEIVKRVPSIFNQTEESFIISFIRSRINYSYTNINSKGNNSNINNKMNKSSLPVNTNNSNYINNNEEKEEDNGCFVY